MVLLPAPAGPSMATPKLRPGFHSGDSSGLIRAFWIRAVRRSSYAHQRRDELRDRSKMQNGWMPQAYARQAGCGGDAPSRACCWIRGGAQEYLVHDAWWPQAAPELEQVLEPGLAPVPGP